MKCISCGEEILDDARFCDLCGAEQTAAPESVDDVILAEEVVEEIPAVCPELDMSAPEQELIPEEVPAEIPALEVEPAVKAAQMEEIAEEPPVVEEAAPVAEPEVAPVVEVAPASVAEPAPAPVVAAAPVAEPAPVPVAAPAPVAEPVPAPQPVYQAPQPVYQAPQPVYQAPQPVYQAPQPVYQAPQPVYQAPQPVYQAPQPVYQAPQPVYQAPQPVYQAPPQPVYQAPQPQYQPQQPQYQPARPAYQPVQQKPAAQRPAFQLPTRRGLGKMFWLGLLTGGIYNTAVMSRIPEEMNMVASRYDGQRTQQYFWMPVLASLTFGIYALVWIHKLCNRMGNELKRRNIDYKFSASTFWLWNVLGSLIVVGPFIYTHKMMKAMNLINRDYNEKG